MRWPLVVCVASIVWGCNRDTSPTVAPTPVDHGEHAPEGEHTFVSTSHNDAPRPTKSVATTTPAGEFFVTTPDAAKALAETAVAEHLDPQQTWTTSPVLPTTWPVKERKVVFFFYPMAANPGSMSHFQLFSAAWKVEVALHDGSTQVAAVAKSHEIGTIEQTRASSLERRELEIAEAALVQQLVGVEADAGESPYWGYLKFIHEHPQIGKDLQRRSPAFLGWVRKRYGK